MKKIRLIELFAGCGSQLMALKAIGADVESWKICEWEVNAMTAYKAIHCPDDNKDYSDGQLDEYLIKELTEAGISNDGKQPMTEAQIRRKGEKWRRKIYNTICATDNLVNISDTTGKMLDIRETDKYTYVVTYSHPCTDLSVAGKQLGMSKGSGTRSGLLWEVERLLNELDTLGTLPQILLMENVTQVHSKKFIEDFEQWISFLESKGYSNFYTDCNARNFGVPQNRDRCFMVSILGKANYEFPEEIPLNKCMGDYLESEVDEKFYINTEKAQKLIDNLIADGTLQESGT